LATWCLKVVGPTAVKDAETKVINMRIEIWEGLHLGGREGYREQKAGNVRAKHRSPVSRENDLKTLVYYFQTVHESAS
jgi:hypothetical protein